MNAIPGSIGSKWEFSFASMDSCVVVGYFAAREARVKHLGYFVPEVFSNACHFPGMVFKKLGATPSFLQKTFPEFYAFVYSTTRLNGNEQHVLTMLRNPRAQFSTLQKKSGQVEQGQGDCKIHVNEEATICLYGRRW